jgi:hypothetical protein
MPAAETAKASHIEYIGLRRSNWRLHSGDRTKKRVEVASVKLL